MKVYHGTTQESADKLLENGWSPNSGGIGGNCGQTRYLYVTTEYDNALWFAEQKGGQICVLEIEVDVDLLQVDPEDGIGETVEEEISLILKNKFPANLVISKSIDCSKIKKV